MESYPGNKTAKQSARHNCMEVEHKWGILGCLGVQGTIHRMYQGLSYPLHLENLGAAKHNFFLPGSSFKIEYGLQTD
jgi:hypothetical protein